MKFTRIETGRLLLRPFQLDDWRTVYHYMSDAAVVTYLPEGQMSEAQASDFVAKNVDQPFDALAVILRSEGTLIGHLVYHPWFAPQTFEIGWVFHPGYHCRGYATEAACALLEYAFTTQKLHRVIATCQPENTASYRVMENIGMRREAHFQKCIHRGGDEWWDEYFYAILAEEWFMERSLENLAAES